jgi:hypothetical protein
MSTFQLVTPQTLQVSSITILSILVDTVNGLARVTYQPNDQTGEPLGGPLNLNVPAAALSGYVPVFRNAATTLVQKALGITAAPPVPLSTTTPGPGRGPLPAP